MNQLHTILLNITTIPILMLILKLNLQVDPKIFFGSGPTKKDAKFAAGTIAWAAIMNPKAVAKKTAEGEAEAAEGSGAASSSALPGETPAQMAVRLAATATAPKLKSAQHVTEEKWLQQVGVSVCVWVHVCVCVWV